MKIDEIFINGDSFSALHYEPRPLPDKPKAYSEFLQDLVALPCVNHAVPGSSNDRIIRTTLSRCLDARSQGRRLFVVLGLTYFSREEIWWPRLARNRPIEYRYFDCVDPSGFVSLDAVLNQQQVPDDVKQSTLLLDSTRQVVHNLTKIFTLAATLGQWDFPYLIFSSPNQEQMFHDKQGQNWLYLRKLSVWRELQRDINVLPLDKWSLSSWGNSIDPMQQGTHLTRTGHEQFARYLLQETHLSQHL